MMRGNLLRKRKGMSLVKVVVCIFPGFLTLLFLNPEPAIAGGTRAVCTVLTIHASRKGGKIDEKLKKLKFLKKPPLSAYKSFSLISEKKYYLLPGTEVKLTLPIQSKLTGKLKFKGVNKALKELNFKLFMLRSGAKQPEVINFAVHGRAPFLYVRPFSDGLLLLSIRCSLQKR